MPVNNLYNLCHVLRHKSRQLKVTQHVIPERQHLLYLVDGNVVFNLNSPNFHHSQVLIDRPHETILIAKVTKCFCFQKIVSLVYYWALIL